MTARKPTRVGALRLALLAALAPAALLAPAAAAHAATPDAPTCVSTAQPKVRPGVERSMAVSCRDVTNVELVSGPEHGELSSAYSAGFGFGFRYRAAAGATADEEVVLRLAGPGGTATVPVTIDVVPATENTPPSCMGDPVHQRTSGTEPVVVKLTLSCGDAEGDDFTLYGGGPGQHLVSPQRWSTFNVTEGWTYRTATSAGTETATIWAVDDLGARSADVRSDVEVGPQVDAPPTCWVEGSISMRDELLVDMRPGRPRRLMLVCWDTDGDAIPARVVSQPAHGTVVLERDDPRPYGVSGRIFELLYTPSDDREDSDVFTFAVGPRSLEVEMRRVGDDFKGGANCLVQGGVWVQAVLGKPLTLQNRCWQTVGDPITATVRKAPVRGSLTLRDQQPDGYGVEDVVATFDPRTDGRDDITIELGSPTSAWKSQLEWTIAITMSWADGWPSVPGGSAGPGPSAPGAAAPGAAAPGVSAPGAVPAAPVVATPAQAGRAAARLLGTKDVVAIKRIQGAVVYADRRAWRRGLTATGRKPALAVTCAAGCDVDSSARLEVGGGAKAKGSAVRRLARQRGSARGEQAFAVRLRLGRADRARVRKARSARVAFDLRIAGPGTAGTTTLRTTVRR